MAKDREHELQEFLQTEEDESNGMSRKNKKKEGNGIGNVRFTRANRIRNNV